MSEAVYEVGASVRSKQDVIARTVGDETILLDLQSGTYFTLNRVGSVIWQGLQGGSSVDKLTTDVVAGFEIDEGTARADVGEFLDEIRPGPVGNGMSWVKARRAADTARAMCYLVSEQWAFHVQGNAAVARRVRAAINVRPLGPEQIAVTSVDTWQVARAVWRAKRWLPMHSTCLQTALATQRLFASKGVPSALRIGVRGIRRRPRWVQVGEFLLDDQRIFPAFQTLERAATVVEGAG